MTEAKAQDLARPRERVLITGLGFAGAAGDGVGELARRLQAGQSAIRTLAPEERPIPVLAAGALLKPGWDWRRTPGVRDLSPDCRDAAERLLRGAPMGLLADAAALLEARRGARWDGGPPDPDRVGLVVGGSNLFHPMLWREMKRFARNPAYVNPRVGFQVLDSHVATTLAALAVVRGPVLSVGAAAASGAVAAMTALDLLRLGRCDACFVLGAMQQPSPVDWQALAAMGALNTRDDAVNSRPFDGLAGGLVPGEAAACVVLERASAVRGPGAAGLAELAGGASVCGADPLPHPSAADEQRAMAAALADAGTTTADLDLITAHATGTLQGDEAESQAIAGLLGEDIRRVWVSAPKGVTGHCLAAAGLVGLVATVLMLCRGRVFPLAGPGGVPVPALRVATGDAVDTPLRQALNNAFGFGGLNAALVVRAVPRAAGDRET